MAWIKPSKKDMAVTFSYSMIKWSELPYHGFPTTTVNSFPLSIWLMPHLAHPLRALCCQRYIRRFFLAATPPETTTKSGSFYINRVPGSPYVDLSRKVLQNPNHSSEINATVTHSGKMLEFGKSPYVGSL